jgi:superfamily II DNA/RNA helicase
VKILENITEHKFVVHLKVTKYSFYLIFNKIIILFSSDKVKPIELYEEANLNTQILSNISRAHFEEPTPIQRYTIPCIRQQDDIMACAQTGSGKTVSLTFICKD